jgi:hypothetical protein
VTTLSEKLSVTQSSGSPLISPLISAVVVILTGHRKDSGVGGCSENGGRKVMERKLLRSLTRALPL